MRRILVIDGDPGFARGLQERQATDGRDALVRLAPARKDAVRELSEGRWDAVVCALDTTGLDGWEMLAHVHATSPTTVRIAVAAEVEAILPAISTAHRFVPRSDPPEDVLDVIDRCCNLQGLLVSPSVARIVGSVGTLPSLPHLYAQLVQMLADPEVGLHDLARTVEKDTAITARILQVANSAFFGLPRQVRTIEQALQYTGVNTVKSLVLAAEVFRSFCKGESLPRRLLEEMQDHALLVANVARRLPERRATAEEAFTAALLHDVGELVVATRLPAEYAENLSAAAAGRRTIQDVERDRWGVTHAEIGAYLLALWGLPETIVEAVAHHHAPMRVAHESFELLDAIHLADHLALELCPRDVGAPSADPALDPAWIEALDLGERLPVWRAMAAEQVGAQAA